MRFPLLRLAVLSLAPTFALAQAGNEVVFVGSSTSGTTDRHAFVGAGGPQLITQAGSTFTDNVSGAVWTNTGRTLYVAQSLPARLSVGAWNGFGITWSTLHVAPFACYGIGLDQARQRVWTLVSNAGSSELRCVDVDAASPTYGATLAETTTLNGPIRERWALAPSGNFAVVPNGTVNSGPFQIVDTDPASPTFLQAIVSAPVPTAQSLGFSFVFDCAVSLDEAYCYMVYGGFGFSAVAVWDRAAGAFLDFDAAAGQQDLLLGNVAGNAMAVALDRSYVLVSSNKAPGQVLRCNIDYATPASSTVTALGGVTAPYANAVTLSPDGTRACVTSTAQATAGPGSLVFFDPMTGGATGTVALGSLFWNLYTTAWQDASPNGVFGHYGAGCPGSLGEPTLAGVRPRIGSNFNVNVANLPFGLAVMAVGFSNTSSSGLPLPLPLAAVGMPGCTLQADPVATATVAGAGTAAIYTLPIPNDQALFGFKVYCQGFALDPLANALGFAATAGGEATIGL